MFVWSLIEEWDGDGLALTVEGWLCSQAAATLLISTSPSGASAYNSLIVRASLGFGARISRAGVFEQLTAVNRLPACFGTGAYVEHNLILSLLKLTVTPTSDFNVMVCCQ